MHQFGGAVTAQVYERLVSMSKCVAVCCKCVASVLQNVAVCCSVLQCVAVSCNVLQEIAVCYSMLQCTSTLKRALRTQ